MPDFPCPVCGTPLDQGRLCAVCAVVARAHLGPSRKGPSPRETVRAAQGRGETVALVRRWRRPLRLGVRPYNPAGPRRLCCAACGRALTRKTRGPSAPPGFPAALICIGKGRYVVLVAGFAICNSHPVYPGRACTACGAAHYVIPGPVYQAGALSPRETLLDCTGRELNQIGGLYECPTCWALIPPHSTPGDGPSPGSKECPCP